MKILHLVKTSVGAKWALQQMKELNRLGVEIHVAMPLNGPLVKEYRLAGISVHAMDYSLPHFYSSCHRLREIIKEVNPDLIHSHFVLTTLIMRSALRFDSRPRIFQVPGPLHLENPFFRTLDIHSAQKNDYWIGSCNWTTECYATHGIARNRLFLSYYGSDIMHKKSDTIGKIRKELKLNDSAIIVGMVAYMYPPKYYLGQKRGLKGHEDFIDAIALVSQNYPQVYGVCIGGPWGKSEAYEQKVKKYAQQKTDHIFFLGTRSDIPELYADMYCVVHPSLSENLGAAAESLALGIPTVATKVGGFPDIVIEGETGLLVPARNPEYLAATLTNMIEGKYNLTEMSEQGKRLVTQMLDVKNTAQKIFEIYHQIIQ